MQRLLMQLESGPAGERGTRSILAAVPAGDAAKHDKRH